MKKKILVTGGAGYIGSHTIVQLLENTDFDVISADNFSNAPQKTYERIQAITGKEIKHYPVDLCSLSDTESIFAVNPELTGVIHFAAYKSVPESVAEPLKYYHNNIESLVNILHCLNKFNVNNFIFSSSCSVYGNITKLPVDENTPLPKAESPYAYTKQIGERMISDFSNVKPNISSIALRYFNPVGAHPSGLLGESPINKPNNLFPVITQAAAGKLSEVVVYGDTYDTRDGSCIRDYIHVIDIANAHILALQLLLDKRNTSNFDIMNLGTGNGVSVLEALNSFEKVSGIKLNYRIGPRREGDVEAIYSDSSKAYQLLGWQPRYKLDEMMLTAWNWEQQLLKEAQPSS